MFRNRTTARVGIVWVCGLAATLLWIAPIARTAEQAVDLDGNALNGAESRVVTRVLQTYPVKVENVVYNNATGEAYTFAWTGAGPGGFDSYVTRGPSVGTKWEWTTVSQVYSILSPVTFREEFRGLPSFGGSPGGIQPGSVTPGSFSVPGKSIYPTTVTLSSTTLTSSLITFFSPEKEVASCGGTFEPGRIQQTFHNNSNEAVLMMVEQQDCCPAEHMIFCPDGCQSYLSDPDNCGACGVRCGGDEFCDQGACEPICPAGQTLCGDTCVDLASDPDNCGGCGIQCGAGEFCAKGLCEPFCPPGQTQCGETCVDLSSDPENCGVCGLACAADEYCGSGACEPICPGQTLCGETCVDLASDPLNCGACGNACGANAICTGGSCFTCTSPLQTACDNQCVNIHTDPYNCGACGHACDFSSCPSTGSGTCSMGTSCVCDPSTTTLSATISFAPTPAPRLRSRNAPRDLASPVRQPRLTPARIAPLGATSTRTARALVEEAPVCTFQPIEQTIEPGETYTRCVEGGMVGREVFTTATVQMDGQTIGRGPCAVIVPVTEEETPPASVAGVILVDTSGDGLCQPGETCEMLVDVQNLTGAPYVNPVGRVSSPPDPFNLPNVLFLNDTSGYPDLPAFVGGGSCETAPELSPQRNFTAFSFTLPADQAPDVGRVFTLALQDQGGTGSAISLPFVIGIGAACDPSSDLDGKTFDGLEGFLDPVNADLVPSGNPVQYSTGSFNRNKTMPLKLRLSCGSQTLDPDQIEFPPQVVSLVHATLGPVSLDGINGTNGANPDDPFFVCGPNRCEYQLRTAALEPGVYVIGVKMPDSRVFEAGFTIRP